MLSRELMIMLMIMTMTMIMIMIMINQCFLRRLPSQHVLFREVLTVKTKICTEELTIKTAN